MFKYSMTASFYTYFSKFSFLQVGEVYEDNIPIRSDRQKMKKCFTKMQQMVGCFSSILSYFKVQEKTSMHLTVTVHHKVINKQIVFPRSPNHNTIRNNEVFLKTIYFKICHSNIQQSILFFSSNKQYPFTHMTCIF